ncbi:TadG family pilus assembly protein [Methylophaga sp. OBS4]|uniref:TadG family pilus assembly protein n=1 Tax=Methylophaga sp. OBS4 TaxID=2991935 RepID=UPI002255EBC7|nr:TadG family pilus assembly protein [Methylophaga sp. OBS4]MCX4187526.1 pilus assembly protein TadG-related protein [Methylophaga sp. OBS4]
MALQLTIPPPDKQRGALGMMGVLTLLLGILFAALAIDTGRLMLEQRHLQTVADMAALDASAQAGHCGEGNITAVEALAQASSMRNGHLTGAGETLDVSLGNIDTGSAGLRQFTIVAPEQATAVWVMAGKSVAASFFAGGLMGNQVNLQATAVAERQGLAGFSAGSLTASISSEDSALLNSLLGDILGSSVNLDLIAYQGIVATDVTLSDLVEATAGVGTVDELLAAEMSLAELLQVYADAVNAAEVANVDVIAAMQTLIDANVAMPADILVGDILAVTSLDEEAALSSSVNLLDLITTTALIANGNNAITLPLAVNLPGGLLNVNTQLKVIEAPQIAIGPPGKDADGNWQTAIKTAQIELDTQIQSTISLVLGQAEVSLALRVNIAQGEAWLQSIRCRTLQSPASLVTIGAQPGIASVALSHPTDPFAPADAIKVSLLGIPVAEVPVALNLPVQNPAPSELVYTVSADEPLPQMQSVASNAGDSLANGLSGVDSQLEVGPAEVLSLSTAEMLLLGPLLGQLLDDIEGTLLTELLSPLLTQLSTGTFNPLLNLLGIQVGAMDVQLISLEIERPELKR